MNVARVNFDTDKFTLSENNWLHMVYYVASMKAYDYESSGEYG